MFCNRLNKKCPAMAVLLLLSGICFGLYGGDAVELNDSDLINTTADSNDIGLRSKSKSLAESSEENYFYSWLQLNEARRFDKIKDLLEKLTEKENVVAVKQTYDWLIEQRRKSSDKDHGILADDR